MVNEIIFFTHVFMVIVFTVGALSLGKEALIVSLALQSILSNLFVTKQMTLFGLHVVCTDVFAVGAMLSLNLLQEYYGRSVLPRAIATSFFSLIFYLVMALFHLAYLPNQFDTTRVMFYQLLSGMPRLVITSVSVYCVVQIFDAFVYALLARWYAQRYLVLRSTLALLCSQFLDTTLFAAIALYGTVPNLMHVIAVGFTVKVIVILVSTPFVALTKKLPLAR